MGDNSAKPSPNLTQTLVPPTEPLTPPTSPQGATCRLSSPTVSHAEWDECMRKSALTIGSTTLAAIAVGLMVPAAEMLLMLGTGAGVLWSIQRCRAIMRDGLLTPEQAKALEFKKKTEREEKRRQRKMEKEAKQRAAAEQKVLEKQRKIDNKKGSSKECCENLKRALKQRGVSVDGVSCEKLSHENEGLLKVENALAISSQSADQSTPLGRTLREDQPPNPKGFTTKENNSEDDAGPPKILTEKLVMKNPQRLKTSAVEKQAQLLVKLSDPFSSVKLFAPYSRYLSESVVLTCDSKECTCSSETESNCTCDPKHLAFEEPQEYLIATDAESKEPPLNEVDPLDLVVQPVNSITQDIVELERNSEVQISEQSTRPGDDLNSKNGVMEQHDEEEEQIPLESGDDEEELEVILSPAFDSVESLNDSNSVELIVEDNEDFDMKIEESHDGFDIEIMNNNIGNERIEQMTNEEEVFAETYKSESWPFSFSLPSLDKFSKKKNNSFKWPPLTSSIIVKPKKEPTCKFTDGSGTPKENEDAHKSCTCGSSKNGCTCP